MLKKSVLLSVCFISSLIVSEFTIEPTTSERCLTSGETTQRLNPLAEPDSPRSSKEQNLIDSSMSPGGPTSEDSTSRKAHIAFPEEQITDDKLRAMRSDQNKFHLLSGEPDELWKCNHDMKLELIIFQAENEDTFKKLSPAATFLGPLIDKLVLIQPDELLQKDVNSMVDNLKAIIVDNKAVLELAHEVSPKNRLLLKWWNAAFQTIDFLLKNGCLSQDRVRDFFRDPYILTQVAGYAVARLRTDIGYWINLGSPDLSDHWYWPFLHGCFNEFDVNHKKILNANLLLQWRHQMILEYSVGRDDDLYLSTRAFLESFEAEKYFQKLTEESTDLSREHAMNDVNFLVNFFASPKLDALGPTALLDQSLISQLVYLLVHIDKHRLPGIISSTSLVNPDFEIHWKLAQMCVEMQDLSTQAIASFSLLKRLAVWHLSAPISELVTWRIMLALSDKITECRRVEESESQLKYGKPDVETLLIVKTQEKIISNLQAFCEGFPREREKL